MRQGSEPRRNQADLSPQVEIDEGVLQVAAAAARRVRSRELTIRRGFIRLARGRDGDAELPDDLVPPMATLLRGSRGGMRLKLYLTLLWMAGGGDAERGHTATFPARAYAELLGLSDPDRKGQRRVREAFATFADADLITLSDRPGHPKTVALLREDGSGESYDRPGRHFEKADDGVKAKDDGALSVHHFVRLDPAFWTQGWAQILSAPAIAVLLAMLVVTTNGTKANQWVSQSERRLYGLSDDTWTKGTAELVDWGILAIRRAPVSRDPFDFKRRRNTYTLILERLKRRPDDTDALDAKTDRGVAHAPEESERDASAPRPRSRRPKQAASAKPRRATARRT
jgi:hypothetical protein